MDKFLKITTNIGIIISLIVVSIYFALAAKGERIRNKILNKILAEPEKYLQKQNCEGNPTPTPQN